MASSKADLILHPLRLRILMTLAGQRMTAGQLATALPDVAQATLYRHLNTLNGAGLIQVVEQRPVRGTAEKVYALVSAHLSQGDLGGATPDDHLRYFIAFIASLLDDFARYIQRGEPNLLRDGVGYHKTPLYLRDDELTALGQALGAALLPYVQDAPGRTRRLFSTVLLPDAPPAEEEPDA